jgi:large conductance mechanosensitive channel
MRRPDPARKAACRRGRDRRGRSGAGSEVALCGYQRFNRMAIAARLAHSAPGRLVGANHGRGARRSPIAAVAVRIREDLVLKEFREFAMKGNVVDLAIGVIIGAAFGKIIESVVGDIFMPIIGSLGGLDFSNYFLPLSKSITATALADARKQGPVLAWGNFVTVAINFMIIAWVLFMVVKGINRFKRAEPPKPTETAPPRQEVLLTEIRDLLARQRGQGA